MNKEQIKLRTANPEDATTIAALATQVFLDTYAMEGVRPDLARETFSQYSAEAFAARLAEPARIFMLAEEGAGLLGFAEIVVDERPAPVAGVSGAELVRLYVQPQAQRSGFGRLLIQSAEQIALAASQRVLWFNVWEGNVRALGFYKHMGYDDIGASSYTFEGITYGNRVLAKVLSLQTGMSKIK